MEKLCYLFTLLRALLVPEESTVQLAQKVAHYVSQVFSSQMKANPSVICAQRVTIASKDLQLQFHASVERIGIAQELL